MKMGSASMCCAVGLWVVLVLIMGPPRQSLAAIARHSQSCVSSCGKITNISYPFRRKDDPPNCGKRGYELECVNDVAVLRLRQAAEYHVQAINYNNYTIRLADPDIQEANCSSIPRYFLYQSNFSDWSKPLVDAYLHHGAQENGPEYFYVRLFQHVMYMSCNSPVREYSSHHVDNNTSCLDLYTYVVAGDLNATGWRWKPGCHVKLIAATSGLFQLQQRQPYLGWFRGYGEPTQNISYNDIHRALAYGFELSWLLATCHELHCGSRPCYFDPAAQKALCYPSWFWRQIAIGVLSYLFSLFNGMYCLITFRKGMCSPMLLFTQKDPLWYHTAVAGGQALVSFLAIRLLFGVPLLVIVLIYKWRRRHLSSYVNIENFLQDNNLMPIRYSYKEIKKMSKNFRDKLGQGGFGYVYKGKLCSGPHVAIKMLKQSKANGQEFINEVATIGRIHHVNVVRLIGFCVEGSKRALIYDYMSNGSLDKHIFSKEGSIPLSYEKIYEISLGVACGISYLHQGCDMQILHFDIKPHNILLDENFVPKVSDFGLAKLYPIDHSIVNLTDKRGTIGYIAPELFYNNIGGISNKADVYSFGMLLMEMANRRKNLNPQTDNLSQIFFPTWVYDQLGQGKEIELNNGSEDENNIAKKMIIVALWCIQLKPSDRPSMKHVVEMLEGELEKLIMPPKPLLYPNDQTSGADESLYSEQITPDNSTNATSDFGETTLSHAIVDNSLSG